MKAVFADFFVVVDLALTLVFVVALALGLTAVLVADLVVVFLTVFVLVFVVALLIVFFFVAISLSLVSSKARGHFLFINKFALCTTRNKMSIFYVEKVLFFQLRSEIIPICLIKHYSP